VNIENAEGTSTLLTLNAFYSNRQMEYWVFKEKERENQGEKEQEK
jgi:hypothetical protein